MKTLLDLFLVHFLGAPLSNHKPFVFHGRSSSETLTAQSVDEAFKQQKQPTMSKLVKLIIKTTWPFPIVTQTL